jgi:acetyltransferase-like isoleucine patch superfamily enzyme
MSQEIDIYIGDNCYIGSGVKFAPGVFIPPNSLCAIGTVATKTFDTENSLIAGVPAKIVKTDINWRENWV